MRTNRPTERATGNRLGAVTDTPDTDAMFSASPAVGRG